MSDDPFPCRRNSLRLQNFDYSTNHYFFITIVTEGRHCLFGTVNNGQMILNEAGRMVEDTYYNMLARYKGLEEVAHVVMPNHLHFLCFNGGDSNIMDAVRWFKSKSTNAYMHGVRENGWPVFDKRLWQTRFYDVVIRNQMAHNYVMNYIHTNPEHWTKDDINQHVVNADKVMDELKGMNF